MPAPCTPCPRWCWIKGHESGHGLAARVAIAPRCHATCKNPASYPPALLQHVLSPRRRAYPRPSAPCLRLAFFPSAAAATSPRRRPAINPLARLRFAGSYGVTYCEGRHIQARLAAQTAAPPAFSATPRATTSQRQSGKKPPHCRRLQGRKKRVNRDTPAIYPLLPAYPV